MDKEGMHHWKWGRKTATHVHKCHASLDLDYKNAFADNNGADVPHPFSRSMGFNSFWNKKNIQFQINKFFSIIVVLVILKQL
jgi:hypothetical protein